MQPTPSPKRPRLTLKILFFVILDVVGTVLFATGVWWLLKEEALFIPGFPGNLDEAVAATMVGTLLMLGAATLIFRCVLLPRQNQIPKAL